MRELTHVFLLPSRLIERVVRFVRELLAPADGPGGGKLARVTVPVRPARRRSR